MLSLHVISWIVGIVVFVIGLFLGRSGGAAKGLAMLGRLAYVVIIITGIWLVAHLGWSGHAILKGVFGILLIGFMEMINSRRGKQKSTGILWVLFVVDLLLVFYYGLVVLK